MGIKDWLGRDTGWCQETFVNVKTGTERIGTWKYLRSCDCFLIDIEGIRGRYEVYGDDLKAGNWERKSKQ